MSDRARLHSEAQMPSPDHAEPEVGGGAAEFGVGGLAEAVLPASDTQEAIAFLKRYRGNDQVVLAAITPVDRAVFSETFQPERDEVRIHQWIDNWQGKANQYFQVNPTLKGMSGRVKAAKTDMRGMTTLHVDLDPRAGEDLSEERVRALKVLRAYEPRPSFIIDSGNGFQGFWLLEEEQAINGSAERIAELEAYNQHIAYILHADPCHNIDRLMRLPGTLNLPTEAKSKKGRKLAVAKLVEWDSGIAPYSLDAFKRAPLPRSKPQKISPMVDARQAPADPSVVYKVDLGSLPSKVSPWAKTVIVQGIDPDEPNRFPSRSEWVIAVACHLCKAGCDRETVVSILTDPDFGISAHVLDQPKAYVYAERQADRAKAFVEAKLLHHLTDMGNAELLVELHGVDLLYCYAHRSWYGWNSERWMRDDGRLVERLVKEVPAHLFLEAERRRDSGQTEIADDVMKWALRSEGNERLRAIARIAQSEIPVDAAQLDAGLMLFNVANGTLDLTTGALQPFSRDDLMTKQAPVQYDPKAQCPQFRKFLARIMGFPTARDARTLDARTLRHRRRAAARLVGFIQRALGYCLTGKTDEQVFFIAHGSGQNGKSTLLEIVRAAFGDYARTTGTETFAANDRRDASGPTENIARLHGARLITAVENNEDQRLDEKLIKQVTGGDKITARHLYQASFEFVPSFKVWIAANSLPEIRGQDPAIWRRPKAIPFAVTIPKEERDRTLKDRIVAEELPGVFAWMVRGCLKWQRLGLRPPAEVDAYTDQYRGDMDIIGDFIAAECEVDDLRRCRTKDLIDAYARWCFANGEQPLKPRTFGRRLRDRGIRSEPMWDDTEGKTVRFYLGICLADPGRVPPSATSSSEDIPF